MKLDYIELESLLVNTVEIAGEVIMQYYNNDNMNIQLKEDNSPVTSADLASNEVIIKALSITGIPILSEESDIQDFHVRKNWKRYWLIDPLDGTKEFINRNGEFTVNIALIEDNIPTMGAVSIPEKNKIYIATNLLESMIKMPYPTRAEANDIYNAIEMGASGLVLAAETAIGNYPKECITFLKNIIKVYKKTENKF